MRNISPWRWFGPIAHGNLRLDAEVLNDDFLNMAVTLMQIADGEQRVHAIFERFADANQQSGRKGNILFARFFDGAQALGGKFVGSIVVGGA